MKSIHHKTLATVSSLAMLLALGACGRTDDTSAAGRAASKTESAGAEAKQDAKDASAKAADDTKAMGASAGSKVDDASITAKVNAELATDKDLSAIRIDVDTKDGVVTLTGPAPTATARERASELARKIEGVTSVNNQLTVKAG